MEKAARDGPDDGCRVLGGHIDRLRSAMYDRLIGMEVPKNPKATTREGSK